MIRTNVVHRDSFTEQAYTYNWSIKVVNTYNQSWGNLVTCNLSYIIFIAFKWLFTSNM